MAHLLTLEEADTSSPSFADGGLEVS